MKRLDICVCVLLIVWLFSGVVCDGMLLLGFGRGVQYAFNAVAILLMAAITFRLIEEDDRKGK